jgi:hypothetical protein
VYSLLSDNESLWGLQVLAEWGADENPWNSETAQGSVFVLQATEGDRFRAYILRDHKAVARIEGHLSGFDDFVDTVNLWWADSEAQGAFLWQAQALGGSLPDPPPDPKFDDPTELHGDAITVLAIERNAAVTHETFRRTLGLVCGDPYYPQE